MSNGKVLRTAKVKIQLLKGVTSFNFAQPQAAKEI